MIPSLRQLAGALVLVCSSACAQTGAEPRTPSVAAPAEAGFTLPPLPYAQDALTAAIDAETMRIHHDLHHQGYVANLNKAIAADTSLKGLSLEQLLNRAGSLPKGVRDNAGGHWNHSFFWPSMTAPANSGMPSRELRAAIDKSFGSFDAYKTAFADAGAKRFGSGWVWLILKADGSLAVTSTPNQDNPLMDIAETPGVPLLGNDVWEYAYYLKYQNRRGDYLSAWWQVVNWPEVSRRYAAAIDAG